MLTGDQNKVKVMRSSLWLLEIKSLSYHYLTACQISEVIARVSSN